MYSYDDRMPALAHSSLSGWARPRIWQQRDTTGKALDDFSRAYQQAFNLPWPAMR